MDSSDDKYVPPIGNNISFDLKDGTYSAPLGNCITFNLSKTEGPVDPSDTQYIYPQTFDSSTLGVDAFIRLGYRRVNTVGFNESDVGISSIRNDTQHLKPVGFKLLRSERTLNDRSIVCQGILNGSYVIKNTASEDYGNFIPDTHPDAKRKSQAGLPYKSVHPQSGL